MCYQEQRRASNGTDCLPAFLTVDNAVLARDVKWVIKDKSCRLKANVVLFLVQDIFVFIPGDLHCHSKNVAALLYHKTVLGSPSVQSDRNCVGTRRRRGNDWVGERLAVVEEAGNAGAAAV